MLDLAVPWWEIVARTGVVYVVVLGLLRLGGKRELGQMTPFDLVMILVIANAVQNAMVGSDVSLTGGLIAAATLVAFDRIAVRLARRGPLVRYLVDEPTVLLIDGRIIEKNLEREGLTRAAVEMAAREHGVADLDELAAAILETDGSISVIEKRGDRVRTTRRRFRTTSGR